MDSFIELELASELLAVQNCYLSIKLEQMPLPHLSIMKSVGLWELNEKPVQYLFENFVEITNL